MFALELDKLNSWDEKHAQLHSQCERCQGRQTLDEEVCNE